MEPFVPLSHRWALVTPNLCHPIKQDTLSPLVSPAIKILNLILVVGTVKIDDSCQF